MLGSAIWFLCVDSPIHRTISEFKVRSCGRSAEVHLVEASIGAFSLLVSLPGFYRVGLI